MVVVIVVAVAAAVAAALVVRRWPAGSRRGSVDTQSESIHNGPTVAGFHMADGEARVEFDVPLPTGTIDDVLTDLLTREAVEVVRDKRASLPLGDVGRVVAFGRTPSGWVEVGSVELDTPGALPPPMVPELLPHASHPAFDVFERVPALPQTLPGLVDGGRGDTLVPISRELRLSSAVEAGVRAHGIDPDSAEACELMLAIMGLVGYEVMDRSSDTVDVVRDDQRIFVRKVVHDASSHPELDEPDIDRFVVDFVTSGADRGLLLTEKFSPFEIYERERREPRMRFITRERFQSFIDALSVG